MRTSTNLVICACICFLFAILLTFDLIFHQERFATAPTEIKTTNETSSPWAINKFGERPTRNLQNQPRNYPQATQTLNRLATERSKYRGGNHVSCLDDKGNVSPDQLLEFGVKNKELDSVIFHIENLKRQLSLAIKENIELADSESKNVYLVKPFSNEASPLFDAALNSIKELTDPYVAERVMLSFPIENFIGYSGIYETVFSITKTNTDMAHADNSHQVEFTYFDSEGKPGTYGLRSWSNFKGMLLNAIDEKDFMK